MNGQVEVRLTFVNYSLGTIRFLHLSQVRANRAIDGLTLYLPGEVELDLNEKLIGRPMVAGVRATVSYRDELVGVAEDHMVYVAKRKASLDLPLRMSAGAVRTIEHRRAGGVVPMTVDLEVVLSILRDAPIFRRSWDDGMNEHAEPVLDQSGQHVLKALTEEPSVHRDRVQITFDPLPWANMLKATGFGDNVFVEIPLPPNSGPPWDEVWKALQAARDALNRGGSTAWKTVVSECRIALEKWEVIEKVDHGPGGLTANRSEREVRTGKQRQDALRWHAYQLAHYYLHTHAGECTRDDAVLVLSTLAGLLAVRKP